MISVLCCARREMSRVWKAGVSCGREGALHAERRRLAEAPSRAKLAACALTAPDFTLA